MKTIDFRDAIGRSFGNYVVVRELGRGAMGAVFVGYQTSLKRQVAIKLLPKALATSKLARQQFRDEAETVAVLDHPNIITIFETGEDEDYFYQVIQLVDGQDLARLLERLRRHPVPARRLLPLHHVFRLVGEVLEGLEYAHGAGVIHQDLKPANVLVENRAGRALIADFGIAKTLQIESLTRGMVVGTPTYLSPEQAAARDTDHRTDLYAVGVVLFELLAGELPVRDEDAMETVTRKVRDPESFFLQAPQECSERITKAMESIILRATAVTPQARFDTAAEFNAALSKAAGRR
ncbi:MAG: serine/threonine-protein kinase [Wenzhouxiangella sp.]|jgi:serine/threonine-protein kinase|nr:serine/threonine-protein kinase [Wenzhouxiangella sp.]